MSSLPLCCIDPGTCGYVKPSHGWKRFDLPSDFFQLKPAESRGQGKELTIEEEDRRHGFETGGMYPPTGIIFFWIIDVMLLLMGYGLFGSLLGYVAGVGFVINSLLIIAFFCYVLQQTDSTTIGAPVKIS